MLDRIGEISEKLQEEGLNEKEAFQVAFRIAFAERIDMEIERGLEDDRRRSE